MTAPSLEVEKVSFVVIFERPPFISTQPEFNAIIDYCIVQCITHVPQIPYFRWVDGLGYDVATESKSNPHLRSSNVQSFRGTARG